MFDAIVTGHRKADRGDIAPLLVSWLVHALAIGAVVLLSISAGTGRLPVVPEESLTFVRVEAPPLPPAPPPPPPPPAAKPAVMTPVPQTKPKPTLAPVPAPVTVPREIPAPVTEVADVGDLPTDFDRVDGVVGGVPGGVPGGVIGGVPGGILDMPLPPPPPPAAEVRAPIRTGGKIQAPALVKRVPPVYPPIAVNANVQGVVILEATVGRDGRVEDVVVLRSVPLLDKAAIEAVRQWEYEPLLLNGQAERFILTVTVSFSLT